MKRWKRRALLPCRPPPLLLRPLDQPRGRGKTPQRRTDLRQDSHRAFARRQQTRVEDRERHVAQGLPSRRAEALRREVQP